MLFVEGHYRIVADHYAWVGEEAEVEDIVSYDDGDCEEENHVGRLPGVNGHHEGNGEYDLVVGKVGELDEVEDGEGDAICDEELDEVGFEAEFIGNFSNYVLDFLFLRFYLHFIFFDMGVCDVYCFLLAGTVVIFLEGFD